jgi:hypothetical protein
MFKKQFMINIICNLCLEIITFCIPNMGLEPMTLKLKVSCANQLR